MLQGLTRAGIGKVGDVELYIRKAAEYGFQAVDISSSDLYRLIEGRGQECAAAYLEEHRVVIGSLGFSVQWRSDELTFRSGLVQLVKDAEAAASLGCQTCCTYIVPSTDYNAAHFMVIAVRRLRICAQILGSFGIRLGLEFVGPHHQRTLFRNPLIWTAQETLDVADAIGEPNVGLLLDALHWYTAEMTIEHILSLDEKQIVHVHLNDAPAVPLSEVLDNDRLFPGEGVIDLPAFLRALKQIGYKGVVAQEILTPQQPADSSENLLIRSRAGFNKVWKAAGM